MKSSLSLALLTTLVCWLMLSGRARTEAAPDSPRAPESPPSPPSVFTGPATGPQAGINLISVGNRYADDAYSADQVDRTLSELTRRGIRHISIRVTWGTIEPEPGRYEQPIIDNLRRVCQAAERNGLSVMLDFHTLFHRKSYACPPWIADLPRDDGSPGLHSVIMVAQSVEAARRFHAMQAHVCSALADLKAIKVVSLMNEPWPYWDRGHDGVRTDMRRTVDVIEESARVVRKAIPGRGVAVRFTSTFNPWSDEEIKRFDEPRILAVLDIIGINTYLDPTTGVSNEAGDVGKGASWDSFARAAVAIRAADRGLWITEFGMPATGTDPRQQPHSPARQADYYERVCAKWWDGEHRPDVVLPWVMQPNPAAGNGYDLRNNATGEWLPAAEVYFRFAQRSVTRVPAP